MKIIAWNCNMAFRKKAAVILEKQPDVLVISECEHPDKIPFSQIMKKPTSILWFGNNVNKGLGIFSFGNFKLRLMKLHNPELRMIIPVSISNGKEKFTLLAIWANNPGDPDGAYIEQVWKAIHQYKRILKKKQTLLAGDFNSNTIWDRKSRIGNHSDVVDYLGKKGIQSTYHTHHQQLHGKEKHPTWYMYRHQDKPYHLDYCFASADLTARLESVEIGDYHDWKAYSDHVPVISTFRDNEPIENLIL